MFDRRLTALARSSRAALTLTVGLGLALGGLAIAQAWLTSSLIVGAFLHRQALASLIGPLMALLAVIVARGLALWASEVSAKAVALRVKSELRAALVGHLFALGPAYARDERTGELVNTLAEGLESLDAYFSQYLPQIIVAALVPLAILFVVLPIDPLSALVLFLTAPLIPVFMILIGRATEALTQRQFETLSRLSAHFFDVLQGLTTLKLLGASRRQSRVVGRVSEQYGRATLSVLRVAFLSALALELVATISTALVAVEVGLRLLYAQLDFQPALFVLILAPEFYLPLRSLGARFHAAASGLAAAKRIFAILDQPARPTLPARDRGPKASPALEFREVCFVYPDGRAALNGVSLKVQPGEMIALAGASGAGKSTLVALLLGFDTPTSGAILIAGVPLPEFGLEAWRACVAYVPQRPHLFFGTIADNIRFARPDASDADVIRAAQDAYLHDFVQTLPQGYDTSIGEGGQRLSGGQAQRLALARAFLRDAPVLILDEPTSRVDPELDARLRDSLARLRRGRTALVIAHRLNTLAEADRVIVLDEGRVVEAGPPAELALGGGLYARFLRVGSRP